MSQTIKYILLSTFLLWPSYNLASSKDKPLVHINPKQTYSQNFGAEQNTKISNWLKDKVEPSLGIPAKESWFIANRAGNYSNVKFFNGKAGNLNMRHLGDVKHDKSGRMLSVLLVRPDDNQKLPTITRPIKPFIVLASDKAIKAGPAPTHNSETNIKVATKKTEKTSAYPGLECIKGNCMNGEGTLKIPGKPVVIHSAFKRGRIDGDVKLISDEDPAYVYEGGFSPDSLTFYGKGRILYKETNTLLSASFYKGRPRGKTSFLYKNYGYEFGGVSELKGNTYIAFQGTVKGKIKTKKDDPALLKKIITEGEYKLGIPVGRHVIKFCQTCSPFYEVNYDENGKSEQTSLYTENGPVHQLVKKIKADHNLQAQGKSNLIKQAKQYKIPVLKETEFFCGQRCKTSYSTSDSVHSHDVRIFLATPRAQANFKVKFGSLTAKECVVKDGYCTVQYQVKGTTKHTFSIEGAASKYPYPVYVMIGGHKAKLAPKPKPKPRATYLTTRDIVAQAMKGISYTTLWTKELYISSDTQVSLTTNDRYDGDALPGGKYRLFIQGAGSDVICMQWETTFSRNRQQDYQRSKKGCDYVNLTNGILSMSGYIVPNHSSINVVTLSPSDYISPDKALHTLVLIKQY